MSALSAVQMRSLTGSVKRRSRNIELERRQAGQLDKLKQEYVGPYVKKGSAIGGGAGVALGLGHAFHGIARGRYEPLSALLILPPITGMAGSALGGAAGHAVGALKFRRMKKRVLRGRQ